MNWLIRAYPFDPVSETVLTVCASLRGWVSEPDEPDTDPNIYWERRVEVPLAEEQSLFDGDDIGGRSTASIGALKIANGDGGIDHWLDWCWDGRQVELYRSDIDQPRYLADWELVTRRTIEEIVPAEGAIDLVLTDSQARFDTPARRGTFAGTGGTEGAAAVKGRAKPFLLGLRRRFEPVLIDATLNKYMIDPAGIEALLDADDGGAPFAIGPNLASDAALDAQDMTGLDLATCRAAGTLRLSEKPLYRLRVSAKGVAPAGTWIYRTADLVAHAATQFAGLTGGEIDSASITAFNALQSAVVGYWHDGSGELSVAALIDALMDGVGGFWGIGTDGKLRLGRYDLPGVPALTIRRRDMINLVPQQAPRRIKTVRLSYRPGLALTEGELSDTITAADRELAMQDREWTEPATDAVTATQSLLAGQIEKDTLFDAEADAEAERDRLLTVLSARRQPFDVTVRLGAGFDGVSVGQSVRLIDTRYGLSAGRDFVVLRRASNTEPEIPELMLTVL